MPEAVFRFGHFVCSIFRRNGRAQVVERSLEARLVPQGRVPLVLLDSTERQAVCFNNIVPCRDMRLHRGKKRVITVIERIGKARVDILLEQVKRLRLVALILREHDAEQQAVRPVKSEQSIDRAVGVNQTVGGGKRLLPAGDGGQAHQRG